MRPRNDFLDLATRLRQARGARAALRIVADAACEMTVSSQATVRLLDPETGLLLVSARSGSAMHRGGGGRFNASAKSSAIGWCVEHAQPLHIEDPVSDPRFVQRQGQTWMPSGILAVPLLERTTAVGVLSVARPEGGWAYTPHDLDSLQLIAELAAPFLQIERLVSLAETDALTLLHNRHHVEGRLPELLADSQRRGEPLSAILLDLDHFGLINNTHGYDVGDRALRITADTMREACRLSDVVVRVGGEEFLILLPGTLAEEAAALAERLRVALAAASFDDRKGYVRLRASLGVGVVTPHDDLESLLRRLGVPVHRAKKRGRNCVEMEAHPDATWHDFFLNTAGAWRSVVASPDRKADYESASGSRYWDAGDGVYRASDHWDEGIRGCDWLLDGRRSNKPAVAYLPYAAFVSLQVGADVDALVLDTPLPAIDWSAYRKIVVLTGEGIDTSVPERRPLEGTEEREAFLVRAARARRAKPNAAHRALAELERRLGPDQSLTILTTNVDGLHQRAGNRHVIELHGTLSRLRCPDRLCGFVSPSFAAVGTCRHCNAAMRPDVVMEGEPLSARTSRDAKRAMIDCDLFVAIGVRCRVSTAARYVRSAEFEDARRIRIHPEPLEPENPAFPESVIGPPERIVPALVPLG